MRAPSNAQLSPETLKGADLMSDEELHKSFLALDPGNTHTAFVVLDPATGTPKEWAKVPNDEIFSRIGWGLPVVIEFPYPRGQGISWQTLATCREAGRFQRHAQTLGLPWIEMDRSHIKRHLCPGKAHAKDPHVRAAIIQHYGGESAIAGGKCKPCKGKGGLGRGKEKQLCLACEGTGKAKDGVLYGIAADCWAALAVALTYRACGPSKSGAQLQAESKERKAVKKQKEIEKIPELQATYAELLRLPPRTPKQLLAWDKRLKRLEVQIQKLQLKHPSAALVAVSAPCS